MLRIKFERTICWMSASLWRSHEKVVRVGRIPRIKLLCFQTFENEVHNELPSAIGRNNWTFLGSDRGGKTFAILRSSLPLVSCSNLTRSNGYEMFFPASQLTRFNNSISYSLTPGLPPKGNHSASKLHSIDCTARRWCLCDGYRQPTLSGLLPRLNPPAFAIADFCPQASPSASSAAEQKAKLCQFSVCHPALRTI